MTSNDTRGLAIKPNTDAQNKRLAMSRALAPSAGFNIPSNPDNQYMLFQAAGIEYASNCEHTFFADPPGVGKTIQSIGHANYEQFETGLIFTPASLVYNWERELKKWSTVPHDISIYRPGKFDPRGKQSCVIFPYSYASMKGPCVEIIEWQKYRGGIKWGSLDEVHNLKNMEAKRTQHIFAQNGLLKNVKRIHALSGTPLVNRPIEMFPVIKRLCPEAIGFMPQLEYGIRFCKGWKSPWGWDFSGASNMNLLGQMLRSNFMVRRKKEDVLPELPKAYPPNIVYIDPDKKAGSLIKEFITLDPETVIKNVGAYEFGELSRVRKECAILKAPACAEYVRDQIEAGHDKIILFAHHREVISILKQELDELGAVVVTGETDPLDRQKAVDAFQTNKNVRVFISSIGAGAVGFTLTASSYVIFAEFSYVPGENEQARDRAVRIGQTRAVQTDFLVFSDSFEASMIKVVVRKMKAIQEFTEGNA